MIPPLTRTRSAATSTFSTSPILPLSLPEITRTRSPFFTWSVFAMSDHLRCERDDPHELPLAKLTGHRAEDAGAAGLPVTLQDHGSVLVELDVRAVPATVLLDGAHHHGLDDLAFLDVATGDRVLDGRDDGVADMGVATLRATEHADAQQLLGTRVGCQG